MNKFFVYIAQLFLLGIVFLSLHFLIQTIGGQIAYWDTAYMHLWQIYALQFLLSVVMIFTTVGIGNAMPQSLGYVFLGFLTLKVVVTYWVVMPVLEQEVVVDFFKYNYLGVFFLFLFFDVYIAYRVLNQLYPSKKTDEKKS